MADDHTNSGERSISARHLVKYSAVALARIMLGHWREVCLPLRGTCMPEIRLARDVLRCRINCSRHLASMEVCSDRSLLARRWAAWAGSGRQKAFASGI